MVVAPGPVLLYIPFMGFCSSRLVKVRAVMSISWCTVHYQWPSVGQELRLPVLWVFLWTNCWLQHTQRNSTRCSAASQGLEWRDCLDVGLLDGLMLRVHIFPKKVCWLRSPLQPSGILDFSEFLSGCPDRVPVSTCGVCPTVFSRFLLPVVEFLDYVSKTSGFHACVGFGCALLAASRGPAIRLMQWQSSAECPLVVHDQWPSFDRDGSVSWKFYIEGSGGRVAVCGIFVVNVGKWALVIVGCIFQLARF